VPRATACRFSVQLPEAGPERVRKLLGEPDEKDRGVDGVERWKFRRPWQIAEF
jgi:hypothetical protein